MVKIIFRELIIKYELRIMYSACRLHFVYSEHLGQKNVSGSYRLCRWVAGGQGSPSPVTTTASFRSAEAVVIRRTTQHNVQSSSYD